jgi:hypothetical protein
MSAVSSLVGTLVVLVAVVFAWRQVREAKLAREVALLQSTYDRLNDPPMYAMRQRIRSGEFDDVTELNEDDLSLFNKLVGQLEFLGIAVNNGLLDFGLVRAVFPTSPLVIWPLAERLIYKNRTYPDGTPAGEHFALLVRRYEAVRSLPIRPITNTTTADEAAPV